MRLSTRTLGKSNGKLEKSAFPDGLFFAWDTALPLLDVQDAVLALGLREEGKGMVSPPLLSVWTQSTILGLESSRPYRSSCNRLWHNDMVFWLKTAVRVGVVVGCETGECAFARQSGVKRTRRRSAVVGAQAEGGLRWRRGRW